jgi:hypothetical protein
LTIHVGEMTSEVVAETEARAPGAPAAPGSERWQELDRLRALEAAAARLARRTCAEGFDD